MQVVHYKGNHYRRKPAWDTKVKNGFIPKGASGVVAEYDGGEYIKPEGSKYWLPICGRSSGVGQWKILHFERPGEMGERSNKKPLHWEVVHHKVLMPLIPKFPFFERVQSIGDMVSIKPSLGKSNRKRVCAKRYA